MSDHKTHSVAVVDNGIFSELAETLSASFGKVYYTAPWVSAFPSSYQVEIGEGFSFQRVNDIWGIVDDVDLFIFPVLFQGPLQEYLDGKGKRVFGSRSGDELENYRGEAKTHFEELDIPQGPYKIAKGITELRRYIQSRGKDKLWIKINLTRKDTETFALSGYEGVKNRLDRIEADLGPVAEAMQFIVEDDLPDTIDIAIDTHCIDGAYPTVSLLGTEEKGEAYVVAVKSWSELPSQLTDIYYELSPTFKKYGYRNFLSLECRTRKDEVWLGDPCCRAGSPPFELQLNMLRNLPEILWEGAAGKLVEPKYAGRYGFELIVHSEWADKNPLRLEFPEEFRDRIKLRYASRFENGTWIMPQGAGPRVAAVVTHGDNLEECFAEAEEISLQIKGIQVESFAHSIPALRETLAKLADWGIIMGKEQ
jgi:hypothetical protein